MGESCARGESSKGEAAAKAPPAMLIRNAAASAGVMSGCETGVSSEAAGRPASHSSTRPPAPAPMPACWRGGEDKDEGASWGRPPRGDNINIFRRGRDGARRGAARGWMEWSAAEAVWVSDDVAVICGRGAPASSAVTGVWSESLGLGARRAWCFGAFLTLRRWRAK